VDASDIPDSKRKLTELRYLIYFLLVGVEKVKGKEERVLLLTPEGIR